MQFFRSLRTSHWPTARKTRDADFLPLIQDVNKAKAQLELIRELYPTLLEQLPRGAYGGWGPDRDPDAPTLDALNRRWGEAISAAKGNYAMAERNREARAGRRRMPTHEEADRLCTAFPAIRA